MRVIGSVLALGVATSALAAPPIIDMHLHAHIDTIEQAPFLSEAQKRDTPFNNAARFLRLTPNAIRRMEDGR